jgi:quercetin dioxygenase-like cupin family protein
MMDIKPVENYGAGLAVVRPMRERVNRLESVLLTMPQVDCPIRHHFAPGMYAREMTIPAGTVVTGAVHKTEHLIAVSMGRLRIVTEDGTREVVAGDTVTCKAGMKNAFVALEDSRWTNFIPNPENITDTDKLVEMFTESTSDELLGGSKNKQLQTNKAALLEASWHSD